MSDNHVVDLGVRNDAQARVILLRLAALLEAYDFGNWSRTVRQWADAVAADPQAGADAIRAALGGMGSFNDIVLQSGGNVPVADNDEFHALRASLLQLCERLVRGENDLAPRKVEGLVIRLRCENCAHRFHTFQFTGDSDYLTDGLASAIAPPHIIVVAETLPQEWNTWSEGGDRAFAIRLATTYGFENLQVVTLRATERRSWPMGRATPAMAYECVACGKASAREAATLTIAQFNQEGGAVYLTGGLFW